MDQDDFQPLESFAYRWRWDSDRCAIVPAELKQIRPLSKSYAGKLWARSLQFVDEEDTGNVFLPSRKLFPHLNELDVSQKEASEVQRWLDAQVGQGAKPILISWQPDAAVLTQWPIFARYWDDFCYPGADDVSIWPLSERWLLHYWHEEVFYFAT